MAKLSRTQKYADLRKQLSNDSEEKGSSQEMSVYEDRMNKLKEGFSNNNENKAPVAEEKNVDETLIFDFKDFLKDLEAQRPLDELAAAYEQLEEQPVEETIPEEDLSILPEKEPEIEEAPLFVEPPQMEEQTIVLPYVKDFVQDKPEEETSIEPGVEETPLIAETEEEKIEAVEIPLFTEDEEVAELVEEKDENEEEAIDPSFLDVFAEKEPLKEEEKEEEDDPSFVELFKQEEPVTSKEEAISTSEEDPSFEDVFTNEPVKQEEEPAEQEEIIEEDDLLSAFEKELNQNSVSLDDTLSLEVKPLFSEDIKEEEEPVVVEETIVEEVPVEEPEVTIEPVAVPEKPEEIAEEKEQKPEDIMATKSVVFADLDDIFAGIAADMSMINGAVKEETAPQEEIAVQEVEPEVTIEPVVQEEAEMPVEEEPELTAQEEIPVQEEEMAPRIIDSLFSTMQIDTDPQNELDALFETLKEEIPVLSSQEEIDAVIEEKPEDIPAQEAEPQNDLDDLFESLKEEVSVLHADPDVSEEPVIPTAFETLVTDSADDIISSIEEKAQDIIAGTDEYQMVTTAKEEMNDLEETLKETEAVFEDIPSQEPTAEQIVSQIEEVAKDVIQDAVKEQIVPQEVPEEISAPEDFLQKALEEVDQYNATEGRQTIQELANNLVDEVRHNEDIRPVESDKDFSNTVSMEISKLMDELEDVEEFSQMPEEEELSHPVEVLTQEEPVKDEEDSMRIPNLSEIEEEIKAEKKKDVFVTDTIPFVVTEDQEEDYIDVEVSDSTPNKVLNVVLAVLIVLLFAILGVIVYYVLVARGIL